MDSWSRIPALRTVAMTAYVPTVKLVFADNFGQCILSLPVVAQQRRSVRSLFFSQVELDEVYDGAGMGAGLVAQEVRYGVHIYTCRPRIDVME